MKNSLSLWPKVVVFGALCVLLALPAQASAEEGEPPASPGEIVQLTPALRQRGPEIHPQLSIFTFNTLELEKNGEYFSYANSLKGLPVIGVNLSAPLGAIKDVDLFGVFRVGYGTKSGDIPLASGSSQSVRLHVVPLEAMIKARYTIPAVPSIKPAFLVGAGTQFFHQSADDSSFSASYFIPDLITGINIGLFDPGKDVSDWFGGFNFGLRYHHGLSGDNRLRGFTFDLAMVVVL